MAEATNPMDFFTNKDNQGFYGGNYDDFMKLSTGAQNQIGGQFNDYSAGLAGSGNAGNNNGFTLGSLYQGDDGNFDMGTAMGTANSMMGLAGGLQKLFGGDPALEERKRVNTANINNMQLMAERSKTAYNNQHQRGSGGRARANGGVDPLKKVV